MIVKCRIADSAPCGKNICCFHCEDNLVCKMKCDEGDPKNCPERIVEDDPLEIVEKALPNKIEEVTDLVIKMKEAEEKIERFKEDLLKAMEDNGIKSFSNDKVSFTYVAPTTRTTFDKKAMLKDHPELEMITRLYNKESKVKGSVRIKVK